MADILLAAGFGIPQPDPRRAGEGGGGVKWGFGVRKIEWRVRVVGWRFGGKRVEGGLGGWVWMEGLGWLVWRVSGWRW